MTEDMLGADICRVCRSEGLSDRPLFHPCICTGSIKWIHQECLVQWMRYSRKEYCELCGYRFSFTPIYSPDMPRRLPLSDVLGGLFSSVVTAVKYWFHYTLVAIAWLGVVPLTACRTYRALFNSSLDIVWIKTLPMKMLSMENVSSDVFHGCFVVFCTLIAFIGLVWLREQIIHAGGPEWPERDNVFVLNQPQVNEVVPLEERNNPRPVARDNNNIPPFVDEPPRPDNQIHPEGMGFAENPVQRPEAEPENPANAGVWRAQVQGGQAQGEAEEANWNPMDWDRPAEELTWERLLGLDGSLLFLEHVFWVILLNTLFILVFAFLPYHIGHVAILALGLEEHAAASHFEGLVTTLCGYCVIGVMLVILHTLAALISFQKCQRILGFCYVVVKVSLLSVVEIGVLPLVCGWWLDICSLSMFDANLRDREKSFRTAPGTSMFMHWLAGMVYIYYFASFILLLREVLRPGVLWFLRNLNDPDFSPIQEMIHLPILMHVRRLVVSPVVCGTTILLMLWLPIKILKCLWPGFLPYTVTVQSETQFQMNELSLELLLLHVILPALLEQSQTRTWLKSLVRGWCRVVAWMLNLQSYLLKEPTEEAAPVVAEEPQPVDVGAAHQALLQREGPIGFQPYVRPPWFVARLMGLFACVCVSLVISSLVVMTLPVWVGREIMVFWLSSAPSPTPPIVPPNVLEHEIEEPDSIATRVHEVYTIACGTYICWAGIRGLVLAASWLPRGRRVILDKIKNWAIVGAKAAIAFTLLLGVIPLLFGLLLELVLVVPLRVPLEQNPIIFIWQDWALGVLYTKIAMAVTMMGPERRLRLAIERVYNDGIREMDLKFVISELAAPVICCFGLALAIPYAVAHGIVPLVVTNLHAQIVIARRLYPVLLLVHVFCMLITFEVRQFKKLYEHIKNDKYLVGQRLVNYEHRVKTQNQQPTKSS